MRPAAYLSAAAYQLGLYQLFVRMREVLEMSFDDWYDWTEPADMCGNGSVKYSMAQSLDSPWKRQRGMDPSRRDPTMPSVDDACRIVDMRYDMLRHGRSESDIREQIKNIAAFNAAKRALEGGD
jgi:hypothetical protein